MPAPTVDTTGFATPKLQDVRSRLVEIWRAAFGENADTSETSPDGLEITTHALLAALVWQGMGQLAAAGYARYARGVFLDLCLDIVAKRRIEASPSTASLVFYGTDSSAVNIGAIVQTESGGEFATDAAATIGGDDSVWVVRVDAYADSTEYQITINSIDYSYTTGTSEDSETIRQELVDAVNAAAASEGLTAYLAGEDADGLLLFVVETPVGSVLTDSGAGDMTRFHAVRVAATATSDGPTTGLTGTIRTMISVVAGAEGVTSTADASVGNLVEQDGPYLARHLRTLSANAARSPEAVAHRIMDYAAKVKGTEIEASVIENESIDPDAEGRPGKSFETYVDAESSVLTDAEIGDLIWQSKTHGAEAVGTSSVNVLDSRGRPHAVGFTRTVKLYAHLEITITDGEGWPSVGTPLETIKAAVAVYFGDGGAGKPRMGVDFYRVAVSAPALAAVAGIAAISVRTDTTAAPEDSPTFTSADIVVAEGERAVIDSSRITMILV
jgi:hypothetical protein